MPNINLLQTITTASSNNTYFVVSSNGLARRFKYQNLVDQISSSIPSSNRTDQNLFTTTDVIFSSLTIVDKVRNTVDSSEPTGIQFSSSHQDGTELRPGDYIGSIKFGGRNNSYSAILDNEKLSTAGLASYSLETWEAVNGVTTRSGTGLSLYHQPVNTQLSAFSRSVALTINSTSSSDSSQSTSIIRLGAIPSASNPTFITTSSNGLNSFSGPGRADLYLLNSRVYQIGIPPEDSSPVNSTLTGTNVFGFITGRTNTYQNTKDPLLIGDTLGTIFFSGIRNSSDNVGYPAALIRAHATCNYSNTNHGAGLHIRTSSSATNGQLVTTLDLQPEGNIYSSAFHRFLDQNYTSPVTISDGTIIFSDSSVQSTAYKGFTSVPASSGSPGITGQMAYDSSYFYICVANNTWKRIIASDF